MLLVKANPQFTPARKQLLILLDTAVLLAQPSLSQQVERKITLILVPSQALIQNDTVVLQVRLSLNQLTERKMAPILALSQAPIRNDTAVLQYQAKANQTMRQIVELSQIRILLGQSQMLIQKDIAHRLRGLTTNLPLV